ncbi:ATP-binding protein [Streptomyces hyaluromycini]|uniref:ATP-binding protein n=1 Tax=Streptomyces hyaluromycini TaxID=1377993 RepID=A0ABV1WRP5_9ACTN
MELKPARSRSFRSSTPKRSWRPVGFLTGCRLLAVTHTGPSVLAAHDLSALTPTAELVAAEFLANAHLHTADPYALRLRRSEEGRLRVAVWDSDPRVPPGFAAGAGSVGGDAESGRGLYLVQACADSWGVSALREPGAARDGKLLWAECQSDGLA